MFNNFSESRAISTGKVNSQFPTFWNHEVNKPLIGTIKGFNNFHHDSYGQQETVIVELKSGEMVSAILNAYLITGMRMQNAAVNDSIFIELLGKDRSNNGNVFNRFNLVVTKT